MRSLRASTRSSILALRGAATGETGLNSAIGVPPMRCLVLAVSVAVATCAGGAAHAQPTPDYDFQWTTVGNVGNAPFTTSNPDFPHTNGRGTVNYEYRASRLEITTGQWVEFLNAFAPFADSPLNGHANAQWPLHIGAGLGQTLPSGNRLLVVAPNVPNAAMLPIGGISWRDAARYCNWLHNDKQVSLAAISTGAYDSTTWGYNETTGRYTDARDRMLGAKFFLPSIDEYLKATHYDPNRFGPGQGGYWDYKNMSNQLPVPGLPGNGTTNAGYLPGGDPFAAWNIPLGAYTNQQSAFGLWDTSGGGKEWLESFDTANVVAARPFAGGYTAMNPVALEYVDNVGWINGWELLESGAQQSSFRIFSTVPSPGVLALGMVALWRFRRARRIGGSSDSYWLSSCSVFSP